MKNAKTSNIKKTEVYTAPEGTVTIDREGGKVVFEKKTTAKKTARKERTPALGKTGTIETPVQFNKKCVIVKDAKTNTTRAICDEFEIVIDHTNNRVLLTLN